MGENVLAEEGTQRKRRSPRTCTKKPNAAASPEVCKSFGESKKTRKRKSPSFEDDPSYSEGEDEDDTLEQQKKVPGYRCSAHLIPDLMKQLNDKQRAWVKNIDFHSLQHMIESRMPKCLAMWLVDRVNTDDGTIEVCGIPVDIRKEVIRILKLPSGDIKVAPPLNGRSKAKRARGDSSHADQKYSDKGRGQTARDATKDLLKETEDEAEFCRSFVMLVLCIYLAPTTSLNINRNYYSSIMDVSKIKLMDWCGFIADYLIQGIKEYRNSKASHVQVPGCVHILPLLYIDALIRFKALILPEALTLPEGEPRIHFIGTEHLAYVASVDVKSRSKDHVEYGLLQESVKPSDCVAHSSAPSFVSKEAENIHQNGTGTPASHTTGPLGEKFVADLFSRLSNEIKESRHQMLQDFHQKLEDFFHQKLEVADQNLLSKYHRILVNHMQAIPSTSVIEDNSKTSTSMPAKEGTTSVCTDIEELKKSGSTEISLSELVQSASCLTDQPKGPENASCNMSVHPMESATTTPAEKDKSIKVMDEQPKAADNVPCNVSVHPMESATFAPVQKNSLAEPSSMPAEVSESAIAQNSEPDENSDLPNSGPENDNVTPDDVVRMGAEAADQATRNSEIDCDPKLHHIPLCILSEAAASDAPVSYDITPAHASARSSFLLAEAAQVVLSESSMFPSPASPLFIQETPRAAVHSSAAAIEGPALFDPSPVPASMFSCMERPAVSTVPAGNASSVSLLCKISDSDSPCRKDTAMDGSVAPDSPQAPPSLSQLISQLSKSTPYHFSLSDEESDSVQDPGQSDAIEDDSDDGCGEADSLIALSSDFRCSQSYTFDGQGTIEIPDDPGNAPPSDIIGIPPLQEEIESGVRFRFGGSVTMKTFKMYESFKEAKDLDPLIADVVTFKFILTKDATATYQAHVLDSTARRSKRLRNKPKENREGTKIQIKGFHITNGEFVDALKPIGEVCISLMGLCSVAIMLDWNSKKKVILDQSIIAELLKEGHKCDHKGLAAKLSKLALEEIELIYIPILKNHHWILAVVNIVNELVEIYDSLLVVKEGHHPHRELWGSLAANLREAYCLARRKSVLIDSFVCKYPANRIQTTIHDCGYHVIQSMECHNSEDLVGYSTKLSMLPFRKYLCHALVYHRFNDLNPLRPHLHKEVPRTKPPLKCARNG